MTTQENEYQKVGRNNLEVPAHLVNFAITLKRVRTLSVELAQPFNYLYTLWKPSHFYTGLEVHSGSCSWRTFRLSKEIYTAAKMFVSGNILVAEVFANDELDEERLMQLRGQIIRSYGLNEVYDVPEQIAEVNKYVKEFFPNLWGTRISCPEDFFEISIISLLLQNTNISRTTTMFRKLIEYYGSLVVFDDVALYSFYSPEDILSVTEEELKESCRLGYRAKYIRNYADFFSTNKESELRKLSKKELLATLETIKGVGTYTSSIVASSALRDTEAIPFDAWNRKILASRLYGTDSADTEALRARIVSDFGKYAGLIAMYVIENEYIDKPVVPLIPDK